MPIGKLDVQVHCVPNCRKCGLDEHGEPHAQPSELFAFHAIDDRTSLVNWDLTLKNISLAHGFEGGAVGLIASVCPFGGSQCTERVHAIGQHSSGRNKQQRYYCSTLSQPGSLANYAMRKNCVAISNDPQSDQRIAGGAPNEPVVAAPLLLPDGTEVGVFVAHSSAEHLAKRDVLNLSSLLNYTSLAVYAWKCKRDMGALQTDMQRVVQQSVREISDANRSRDTFIATMSHEIRTPITSTYTALQLLNRTPIEAANKPKIERLYQVIQHSSGQLLELINDILDFCKLRSTTLKLADDDVNLYETLNAAAEMFYGQCNLKNVELRRNIEQLKGVQVRSDSKRIKQIVLNLLSNALKFTDMGHIELSASLEKGSAETIMTLTISDTGSGISAENMKRVFEPYFTARRKDWSEVLNGVGLGLAISRELASLMGGSIELNSDGIKGTTATVIVPFKTSDYMDRVLRSEPLMRSLRDVPIMILDDRLEQRMYMMKLTRRWGMVPHSFTNSAEALMALEVLDADTFRVALVDVDLSTAAPNDTGAIFAQSVRSKNYHMKLIAVSSVGTSFGGDQLFDHVLVKPVGELQLYETVRVCFEASRSPVRRRSGSMSLISSSGGIVRDPVRAKSDALTWRTSPTTVASSGRTAQLYSGARILFVDDDTENASMFVELLQEEGFTDVAAVHSAEECLFKLSTVGDYDIVFMDIVMPTTDGIACTRRIRASPDKYGKPRIIALTADDVDSTKFNCLQSGFDYFLTKPPSIDDFKTAVHWVMAKKSR